MNDLFITICVIIIIMCGIAFILTLTTYFMILTINAKIMALHKEDEVVITPTEKEDLEDAERYIIGLTPTDSHDYWN